MVVRCNKIPPQARLQWFNIACKVDYFSKKWIIKVAHVPLIGCCNLLWPLSHDDGWKVDSVETQVEPHPPQRPLSLHLEV
jgi:hypothetical protein